VAAAERDPIDVVYLSKKFTTTPIFTPHFKIGGNLSTQSLIVRMDPIAQDETVTIDRNAKLGLNLGAGIEWNINDNFGLGAEALLSYKSFEKVTKGIFGRDSLQVIERQYLVDFPIYLRYGYNLGKFRPYAYTGGALNLLIADRLHLEAFDKSGNETEQTPTVGPNIGIEYKRNRLNASLVFGGGVKYKVGKNFVLFDLRYMAGLKNVTNKDWNPYDDKESYGLTPDLVRYGNFGDWFRVNSYCFSIGFVRPLYDPRPVKKVKTKGVSRKLSKDE
jgi:opacity protein-like surface antigen